MKSKSELIRLAGEPLPERCVPEGVLSGQD